MSSESKIVTAGESVKRMLLAQIRGDGAGFRAAVRAYVDEEKRKNHHVVARDLERILGSSNGSAPSRSESLTLLVDQNGMLPRDKERGALLIEMKEASRCLDSLVLTPSVRRVIDRIVEENHRGDVLRTFGLRPIDKVLFCGPPGCGKTVTAEAIAEALSLPLVLVRFDAVVSSYLGETAANLRKVFDFARSRPMVLFFDEFDSIGKERASEEEHGELKRVVTSLLQMIDGFRAETLTIAASNHQGMLDPALWRRFDEIIYLDKPNANAIEDLLVRNLRQTGLETTVHLKRLARTLLGMSHADIERIARDAIKQKILVGFEKVTSGIMSEAVARQRERRRVTDEATNSAGSLRKTERPKTRK